jgi:hypothetical protein
VSVIGRTVFDQEGVRCSAQGSGAVYKDGDEGHGRRRARGRRELLRQERVAFWTDRMWGLGGWTAWIDLTLGLS